jgi:PhnB protein
MFDGKADWPATPVFLRLYVDDCEATYRLALISGAKGVTEPTLLMFGDRVARIRDPFGNIWWIHSRVENLSREEVERRAGEQKYIDAMHYVETSLQNELSSGSPKFS